MSKYSMLLDKYSCFFSSVVNTQKVNTRYTCKISSEK